ncbi:glycosyltransferase family 2 protein [Noviherbaspirillum sedimenti]|uniref:Glycosyltransferase family 2 protein n=1 Tax=Noviherbaspirillum sedimenti TaxID=2320865 RepID=A0A3A3G0B3_9BURK|nr:glycosyltransferase family 2 protein [Noviherbaspirillum sedimenti]RJG01898.1 glycosyltransferase family 2 protein [Noviherbaspirillum sedimenti]
MTKTHSVVVSILNWNTSESTINCVNSVLKMQATESLKIHVIVIDNGSASENWEALRQGINHEVVSIIRKKDNLGFAGGHNVAIQMAIAENADFIWLVNSDAIVTPETLGHLVSIMESDPTCGAVSPVIVALHDEKILDFCGAQHDWGNLDSIRPRTIDEALHREANHLTDMWVAGTVVLFRIAALKSTGFLDEGLFAYFEDDDIGARLSCASWTSRMATQAIVRHAQPHIKERPAYYFYLTSRNSFRFWLKHTPKPYRRFIRLRLLDRALFTANRLYRRGSNAKAEACLLGALDGFLGRYGVPDLNRRPPVFMQLLRKAVLLKQFRLLRKIEPSQAQ